MFLITLIRRLRGYVRFSARGPLVERFLNLLARERIVIWEARRRDGELTGCVSAGTYVRMRPLAKKSGVRLRILSKHGAPFKRKKLKKRRGLLVGFALFVSFLFIMSKFIWSIQVNGNKTVPEDKILQALEEIGIKPGILRSSIDVRESEGRALLKLRELSWIALNIDGSAIHVEVNETMPIPPMVDPNQPCNVVAARSGQILEMRVYDGQAVLENGAAVLEGQVIVSGITQDRLGKNLFKHARADIIAELAHQIEIRVPLNQTTYVEKGKVTRRGYLRVFGYDLPLFPPFVIPRPYLVERSETPWNIFSLELPVSYRKEIYTLMREVPVSYTEQEAKEMALAQLAATQKAQLGEAEIIERTLTGGLQGDQFVLLARYVCHMNIAVEKEILQ